MYDWVQYQLVDYYKSYKNKMSYTKPNILKDVIRTFGVVFGDIGTSPIYTMPVIFMFTPITLDNVLGIVSLIIWTLILIVTMQYVWLAMSLNCNGEGGTIVLREMLLRLVMRREISVKIVAILSFIAISLTIGDSIITPAISILSSVEGLSFIPNLNILSRTTIVMIACAIIVFLFSIQNNGTEKVGNFFGPIMLIWFLSLAILGILHIISRPQILLAFNPIYAIQYLFKYRIVGFSVLANVILCATGGESLFADMGHFGRKSITYGWTIVFIALILHYMGQGAFLLYSGCSTNLFFSMAFALISKMYPLFLVLVMLATMIASQTVISSLYSICFQSINNKLIPRMKIRYTSLHHKSQIYIPFINWFLMCAIILVIILFKYSLKLTAAYGFAMSGTMTITSIFLTWIFFIKRQYLLFVLAIFMVIVDSTFFLSGLGKLTQGGYWSLVFASIPFSIITLYVSGQHRLYKHTTPVTMKSFINTFNDAYKKYLKIRATGVFLVRDSFKLPVYVHNTIIVNKIIYQDNILVSLRKHDHPFGLEYDFENDLTDGLRHFVISVGYMTFANIEKIFLEVGIFPVAIFYGIEEIETNNFFWQIFALIKKIAPSFVKFYNLPTEKLHGVMMSTKI